MDNKELKKKELQERIIGLIKFLMTNKLNVRYGRRGRCGTHLSFLKEFSKKMEKEAALRSY